MADSSSTTTGEDVETALGTWPFKSLRRNESTEGTTPEWNLHI